MKITSVTITNFRSFTGTQTFVMPEEPGLYFMQGVNEAEPRLEGNATGKTTIWQAIYWCFFDKLSTGLKAGDVCNWEAEKGAAVSINFYLPEDLNCLWTVKRTWKPNTWTLSHDASYVTDEEVVDLTKGTENPVLEWLGLNGSTFLNCILMAQDAPMFLDMKAEQQATLFGEVMGLDLWIDYSSAASKKASNQDVITRSIERKLAEVKGQLGGQHDFTQQIKDFDADKARRLDAVADEHKKILDQVKTQVAKTRDLVNQAAEIRTKYQKLRGSENLNEEPARQLKEKIRGLEDDLLKKDELAKSLEQLRIFLASHEHCPTCDQDLDSNLRRVKMKAAQDQIMDLNEGMNSLEYLISNADQQLQALGAESKKQKQTLDDCAEALSFAELRAKEEQRRVELIDRRLDELEDRAAEISAEKNTWIEFQELADKDQRSLLSQQRQLTEELDASNERYSLFSYWVRGFKDLRLQLIAEALMELEIEVNSCVTALGLTSWELKFEVDRETKGGSISRGFSVKVISPGNDRAVPWEAWSGGEKQRLRLAATMGLSNLIRTRTGAGLPLEVWDEPAKALSPQGVQDLLEALERRAQVESRVIWVVDHTAHSFGGFAGGAVITKSESGSSIKQY